MKQSLFEIGAEMAELEAALTDLGGDITDEEIERKFDEWFASLTERLEAKVNSYCWLIEQFQASAEARKAQAQRLQKLAQADANAAARLEKRLKDFMIATGKTKLKTEHFNPRLANNGGKQPLWLAPEVEAEPARLPERFHKTTVTIDKDELRAALEAGEVVTLPSAAGEPIEAAKLLPRGVSLRIR
jgi:hypothetical protein